MYICIYKPNPRPGALVVATILPLGTRQCPAPRDTQRVTWWTPFWSNFFQITVCLSLCFNSGISFSDLGVVFCLFNF